MNHVEYCVALEREVDRFATVLREADDTRKVPSCPEWTIHDLAEHLGIVHRWAEHLVRVRAQQRISSSTMDFERGPVNADWLERGGASLVATLRAGDPDDPMWAWGRDQHLRFWSRRQLHETFVHRIDLELGSSMTAFIEPAIAIDAIDEFFENLEGLGEDSPSARTPGVGELVRVVVEGSPVSWNLQLHDTGFRRVDGLGASDAELSGSPGDLLMVLLRRASLEESKVVRTGDQSLIEHWLAGSDFT